MKRNTIMAYIFDIILGDIKIYTLDFKKDKNENCQKKYFGTYIHAMLR